MGEREGDAKAVEYVRTELAVRWIAVTRFAESNNEEGKGEGGVVIEKKEVELGKQIARAAVKFITAHWNESSSSSPSSYSTSSSSASDPVFSTLETLFGLLSGAPLTYEQALSSSSPTSSPLLPHIPTTPSPNLSWLIEAIPHKYVQKVPELIKRLVEVVGRAAGGGGGKGNGGGGAGEEESATENRDVFAVAVNRMIAWGVTSSLAVWISAVLSGLASAFQFSTLSSLSTIDSSLLLSQFYDPIHRGGALVILRQLWLCYDHYSPKAFHMRLKEIQRIQQYFIEQEEKRKRKKRKKN